MIKLTVWQKKNAVHLDDGAYITSGNCNGEFMLFTSNGIDITNTVYIGPDGMTSLKKYIEDKT